MKTLRLIWRRPCSACRKYTSETTRNRVVDLTKKTEDAMHENAGQPAHKNRHTTDNSLLKRCGVEKDIPPILRNEVQTSNSHESKSVRSELKQKLSDTTDSVIRSAEQRDSQTFFHDDEKEHDVQNFLLSSGERKYLEQYVAPVITEASGLQTLQPGDLIETREILEEPKLKLHLMKADVEKGGSKDMFLDDCGGITFVSPNAGLFTIPQFVPSHILEKVMLGVVSGQIPSWIRTHSLVAKLREFKFSADERYMRLGIQSKVSKLYDDCIKERKDSIDVFDASRRFYDKDTVCNDQYLATHMALMQDSERFFADPRRHRNTSSFGVLEPRLVQLTQTVSFWIQNDNEELRSFLKMAREQIMFYREEIKAHDGQGKLDQYEHGANFSQSDLRIIEFVKTYVFERRGLQWSRFPAHVCKLMKSIGLYQEIEITQDTALKLLIELGVYRPWENLLLYDRQLALPHYGATAKADFASAEMERKYSFDKSYESLGLSDVMLSKRKDWRELPVYCIDSATTTEVDDGISIERVSPEVDWLHVHVANPSAFIPRNHELAVSAEQRLETIYLPERMFFMLPPLLSQQKFSLRQKANNPVITFSAKVSALGEILDYKVQHGFVHNVKTVTYNQADRVFGYHTGSNQVKYSTASRNDELRIDSNLVDLPRLDRLNLDQIRLVAKRLMRKRLRGGAFNISRPVNDVHVQPYPLPLPTASTRPQYDRLLPTISLTVAPNQQSESFMWHVAEVMIAAGNVAAKFCDEHHIPSLFRATETNDTYGRFSEIIGRRGTDGLLSFADGVQISKLVMTKVTSEPGRHDAIGLNEYARATSPLRRYADLLLHWQIDAFIRKEALPLDKLAIERDMHDLSRRERLLRTISRNSQKFWVLQGMKRLFDDNRLPTLTARVTDYAADRNSRLLTSFGVNANADLREEEHVIGQEIEVIPERFDFVDRTLLVKKI